MENTFQFIWQLLKNHGGVANHYQAECERLWNEYSTGQQREIYRSIRRKLQAGQFVNYNPVRAVRENAPRQERQVLSYAEYYKQYGTTAELDGWKMANPTGQQVIYVKGGR